MENKDEIISDDSDEEIVDLESIRDKILSTQKCDRMQVSAWDDDDTGIEDERNAKEPDEKAFLSAAEEGKLNIIIKMLNKNPKLLECTDKDGYTPLHRACYGNHANVVQYLLQNDAKIDAKTLDDWQPLHSAACWNNVECAEILLENGADINAKSKGDQTPLHLISSTSNNAAVLQLFLLHPDIDTTIVNSSGDTPYMIAKRYGTYHPMFEITESCLNDIHGKHLTK